MPRPGRNRGPPPALRLRTRSHPHRGGPPFHPLRTLRRRKSSPYPMGPHGAGGGSMRSPNRHPHKLTIGIRLGQYGLSRFLPLIDWPRFRLVPIVPHTPQDLEAFACADATQAVIWHPQSGLPAANTSHQPVSTPIACRMNARFNDGTRCTAAIPRPRASRSNRLSLLNRRSSPSVAISIARLSGRRRSW